MKVKIANLKRHDRIETLDTLYTAASVLKGRDATKRFLRDLLTPSERVMLGRRIMIAQRILNGEHRRDICAAMKVGPDTVHRVARWLDDQIPGYEDALRGAKEVWDERTRTYLRKKSQHPTAVLKRKYPLHFLLVPWPKDKDL